MSAEAKEALAAPSQRTETPWSPLSRILDFNHFLPPPRESQPSMRQLLDRLGHQLEEMLLYCRYQGEMCGPRNFSTVSVTRKSPPVALRSLFHLKKKKKIHQQQVAESTEYAVDW